MQVSQPLSLGLVFVGFEHRAHFLTLEHLSSFYLILSGHNCLFRRDTHTSPLLPAIHPPHPVCEAKFPGRRNHCIFSRRLRRRRGVEKNLYRRYIGTQNLLSCWILSGICRGHVIITLCQGNQSSDKSLTLDEHMTKLILCTMCDVQSSTFQVACC